MYLCEAMNKEWTLCDWSQDWEKYIFSFTVDFLDIISRGGGVLDYIGFRREERLLTAYNLTNNLIRPIMSTLFNI